VKVTTYATMNATRRAVNHAPVRMYKGQKDPFPWPMLTVTSGKGDQFYDQPRNIMIRRARLTKWKCCVLVLQWRKSQSEISERDWP